MKNKLQKKAFSIIEVLIGIFIFSMWLMSVYMLLQSSININLDNKNRIIASNLAREGIELVRNIRDSNYETLHLYNQVNPKITSDFLTKENLFQTWIYYKISNNFLWNPWDFPVKLEKIDNFWEWINNLQKMENYRLCLDNENRYSYCDSNFIIKTIFYRFMFFEDLDYKDAWVNKNISSWYKVTSKIYWYSKWLHDIEIKTAITDYKNL